MKTGRQHWATLILFLLIAALTALSAGCSSERTSRNKEKERTTAKKEQVVKQIDPDEAHVMINENEGNKDFVILDVREPEEFDESHLAGAINLDFYEADFRERIEKLDKSKTYLVYCRSANRSAETAKIMEELGFETIYDMSGGIVEWERQGFPTVGNQKEPEKTRVLEPSDFKLLQRV